MSPISLKFIKALRHRRFPPFPLGPCRKWSFTLIFGSFLSQVFDLQCFSLSHADYALKVTKEETYI
jgi:hypothetical protein